MMRRLRTLVAALTLPWCVAAIVLWVRGPGRGEFFGTETVFVSGGRAVRELRGVWSGGGRVMVGLFRTDTPQTGNVQTLSSLPPARDAFRHLLYGGEPYPAGAAPARCGGKAR